jgi:hypothetical protein
MKEREEPRMPICSETEECADIEGTCTCFYVVCTYYGGWRLQSAVESRITIRWYRWLHPAMIWHCWVVATTGGDMYLYCLFSPYRKHFCAGRNKNRQWRSITVGHKISGSDGPAVMTESGKMVALIQIHFYVVCLAVQLILSVFLPVLVLGLSISRRIIHVVFAI